MSVKESANYDNFLDADKRDKDEYGISLDRFMDEPVQPVLYDQTKATAETKKAKAKVIKTKQSKGRVLKAKKSPSSRSDDQRAKQQKARERLRSSTDMDDVTDALMARWER